MLVSGLFLVLSVCHGNTNNIVENNRELIVGGQDAREGRYSFAEISLQLRRSHQCGGTLIAPDMILTAAHCQNWIDTAHIHRYDFQDNADVYTEMDPAFIHVHPDFNPTTFQADFSIVGLRTPVPSAEIVRLNTDANIPGHAARVAGVSAAVEHAPVVVQHRIPRRQSQSRRRHRP